MPLRPVRQLEMCADYVSSTTSANHGGHMRTHAQTHTDVTAVLTQLYRETGVSSET